MCEIKPQAIQQALRNIQDSSNKNNGVLIGSMGSTSALAAAASVGGAALGCVAAGAVGAAAGYLLRLNLNGKAYDTVITNSQIQEAGEKAFEKAGLL